MKRTFALALAFFVAPLSFAQKGDGGEIVRAWQQRISVEVPLKIPSATALPTNPFFTRVDESPERSQAVAPRSSLSTSWWPRVATRVRVIRAWTMAAARKPSSIRPVAK